MGDRPSPGELAARQSIFSAAVFRSEAELFSAPICAAALNMSSANFLEASCVGLPLGKEISLTRPSLSFCRTMVESERYEATSVSGLGIPDSIISLNPEILVASEHFPREVARVWAPTLVNARS